MIMIYRSWLFKDDQDHENEDFEENYLFLHQMRERPRNPEKGKKLKFFEKSFANLETLRLVRQPSDPVDRDLHKKNQPLLQLGNDSSISNHLQN